MALGPGVGSLRWACTFHIFCVDFVSDANPFFSGIWALGDAKVWRWGSKPMPGPNANGFASQWNIGFSAKEIQNKRI